mmetsp:Transcript_9063/g.12403  ORF Transcript_9063/g.12403 Transcript_9063/m.12403 type:complete len:439 (+) Transcript_9063:18-1334(+)
MEETLLESQFFNLQLTVQKLEEELVLYRNGTTSQELMDYLAEKDNEIVSLKSLLSSKDEALRKIVKSSADVLNKYNVIADENSILRSKQNDLLDQIERMSSINAQQEQLEELNQRLQDQIDVSENAACNLKAIISENEETIKKLNENIATSDGTISKLQIRCAELVKEKNVKSEKLDNERQEMLDQVLKFKESIGSSLLQRDDMIKKQGDLIQKMNVQITSMQKELESKDKTLEEKLHKRDLHWQSKLQSHISQTTTNNNISSSEGAVIEELRNKTEQLRVAESTAESLLNENIELRSRVSHLEESIHQLEKQIKKSKGGLKDRGSSNIIPPNDTNNNVNNHEEDDKKHKPMDIVSKILFTPKSRSVPLSGEPTPYLYNSDQHLQHQQIDSLNMNHRSQQQPSQMVIQMKSSSSQDIHPGVFSHSDKPVKVKPLTRIL